LIGPLQRIDRQLLAQHGLKRAWFKLG
jgi:hypothetical protein